MAHDIPYPYYADQYAKDARDWVIATEVPAYRQGQMLIWALGGQARKLFEGMTAHEKQHGCELRGGQRVVRVIAVEFILGVLESQSAVHEEIRMVRIGWDFFKFAPRRNERPEEWFTRFDNMFEDANRLAHLGLSITFQSWMLFSLLQLPAKKWSELLKGIHHGLPQTRAEYVDLQQAILREKMLEDSIFDLRGLARNVVGAGGQRSYFSHDDAAEHRPLYLCLCDPDGTGLLDTGSAAAGSGGDVLEILDGHYLVDDSDSEASSDDEQWGYQDQFDRISAEERRELAASSESQLADFYWAMRRATRRFRIAKGKGGPRRRTKGGKFRRTIQRYKGGGGRQCRRGFFVGESFVSLDEVPEEDLEVFFKGRKVGPPPSLQG